jgi:hypothetical protein
LTSGYEGLPVVEPEFHHPIVIGSVFISRDDEAMALYQSAEVRNTSAEGSVDIFPVMKELFVCQACLLGDAINEFHHSRLRHRISSIQP